MESKNIIISLLCVIIILLMALLFIPGASNILPAKNSNLAEYSQNNTNADSSNSKNNNVVNDKEYTPEGELQSVFLSNLCTIYDKFSTALIEEDTKLCKEIYSSEGYVEFDSAFVTSCYLAIAEDKSSCSAFDSYKEISSVDKTLSCELFFNYLDNPSSVSLDDEKEDFFTYIKAIRTKDSNLCNELKFADLETCKVFSNREKITDIEICSVE
ncbi:MAG: hypothetical protein ACOCUU_02465 [Nanoarchaeota archaeon]